MNGDINSKMSFIHKLNGKKMEIKHEKKENSKFGLYDIASH